MQINLHPRTKWIQALLPAQDTPVSCWGIKVIYRLQLSVVLPIQEQPVSKHHSGSYQEPYGGVFILDDQVTKNV